MRESDRYGRGKLFGYSIAFILWGYANKGIDWSVSDTAVFWVLFLTPNIFFLSLLIGLAYFRVLLPSEYGAAYTRSFGRLLWDSAFCYVVLLAITWLLRYPIAVALNVVIDMLNTLSDESLQRVATKGYWITALTVLSLSLSSILEEVVYRGMLGKLIMARTTYVLVSSLLFAGIHIQQGVLAVFVAAAGGVAACLIYLHMRTIVPLVVGHIAVNMTVLAVR